MRVLIGAAAVALLTAVSAFAQTPPPTTTPPPAVVTPPAEVPPSRCPALSDAPALPDGAVASAAEMEAGNTTYQTWATAYQAAVACRRTEVEELRAIEAARRSEYNAAAERLNTTTTSWVAEAAEFNARPARSRR
jgi:hypothetical protein